MIELIAAGVVVALAALKRLGSSPPTSFSAALLGKSDVPAGDEDYLARAGWTRDGCVWRGRFRTGFDSYEGRIEARSGELQSFIRYPPSSLLTGRHSACIHAKGNGWFYIHENTPQASIVEAVAAVEGFLLEKSEEEVRVPWTRAN